MDENGTTLEGYDYRTVVNIALQFSVVELRTFGFFAFGDVLNRFQIISIERSKTNHTCLGKHKTASKTELQCARIFHHFL